jgi:hypothetical protein
MKNIIETDYVIYDWANDHVVSFENGDVVIFGSKHEAVADCRGNEKVIPCTDLPNHWKEFIIKQINK